MRLSVLSAIALVLLAAGSHHAVYVVSSLCFAVAGASLYTLIKRNVD